MENKAEVVEDSTNKVQELIISDLVKSVSLPTRDTAPFLYDIGSRTLKGAGIGMLLGFVFFKRGSTRRFCTYYGAGFGLGMSYSQIQFLYGKLMGEQPNHENALKERRDDLIKEQQLR